MTFVGKILVIAIMAFSLLFLGLSTVAFTTAKNWMVATQVERKKVDEFKKKVQDAQAVSEASKKGLDDAKAAFAAEVQTLKNRATSLEEDHKRDLDQITAARGQIAAHEQTAKS